MAMESEAKMQDIVEIHNPNGYHQNTMVPHKPRQKEEAAKPRRVVQVAGVRGTGAGGDVV
jgi:hypothetical protein